MGSYQRLALVISVILISAVLLWFTQGGIIDVILYPFRTTATSIQNWFGEQSRIYSTNKATQEKLAAIELQNASLSAELAKMKEIELENERYRNILKLPLDENLDKYGHISARIIERSPNAWYDAFVINKGSRDNIKVDDVVSTPTGIIGKIIKVSGPDTSIVLSLSDVHNNISLINQRSRDVMIAQGAKDNMLKSRILYAKADMKEGDILLSSGLGAIYPRYVPVAKIVKITKKDIEPLPLIEMELLGYDKYWEEVIVFVVKPTVNKPQQPVESKK